jgi:hypothetical protein
VTDDLVKQLRALAADMAYGDDADAAELCRLSADAIDRLTAERDAALELVNSAAVVFYSMHESGIEGTAPWWGHDYLHTIEEYRQAGYVPRALGTD